MILPIIAHGNQVLKNKTSEINKDYPELDDLINNMFETMYNAQGVGLAAPQVGLSIRLFVIDATPFKEENEKLDGFKKVFINPVIIEESGKEWTFNEGCLSFPLIREDVRRKSEVFIKYYDENFNLIEKKYGGIVARIIQHEYDHLEGKVLIDKVSPFKRQLLKRKLNAISKGNIDVNYKMKFPHKNKKL